MKILITGSNINAFLTAKFIKTQNPQYDIYVTTEEVCPDKSYTAINISENDINEIRNFIKYNQIDFTISMSGYSIINGLADVLKKEQFPVFAPMAEAARVTFFNSIAKKIMYKLKINTPRFGIFDRENTALDYVRRSTFPIDILNDFTLIEKIRTTCKSFPKAKEALQKIYEDSNEKIIIENYINSNPINIYFVTDGFNALPLIYLERKENNYCTQITAPDKNISEEVLIHIMRNVIYPLIDDIAKYTNSYSGIIGLKLKLENNNYQILEFYNNFDNYDYQAFLSVLNENLCSIFYDTANGSLVDNYNYIKLSECFSYTVAINKEKINIQNELYEEDEFFISEDKNNVIITSNALTINKAKEKILNLIEPICSKEIIKTIQKEEIKV